MPGSVFIEDFRTPTDEQGRPLPAPLVLRAAEGMLTLVEKGQQLARHIGHALSVGLQATADFIQDEGTHDL